MHSPTLTELPPPPPGKTGWPWTVETPPLPPARPDGWPWPRISVVTPSYNQAQFIEETIRSVLLQGYPDLEYVIIDGGSSDDSVAIIQKYQPWLKYWVSEKDGGQADAINKGVELVSGEVFNFINSDDVLCERALSEVGQNYTSGKAVAGGVLLFGNTDEKACFPSNLSADRIVRQTKETNFRQPGLWFDTSCLRSVGKFHEELHFSFDGHMWIKYLYKFPEVVYSNRIIVKFRYHDNSKTVTASRSFRADRVRYISDILSDKEYVDIHDACSEWLAYEAWRSELQSMMSSNAGRLRRVVRLMGGMLADPRARFTRLSLGAIRRIITSKRSSWPEYF